jgi:PAS domain S-box-containing protein
MPPPRPTPTGQERLVGADDLLVSKTDPRGVITYANSAFIAISGYREGDLVGANHNLVRHPGMPKAAFRSLWDTVAAGQEWRGIVKNLAKDGCHYWVAAMVTPSWQGGRIVGYMSVRRRPTREQIEEAVPLYRQWCAEEGRTWL